MRILFQNLVEHVYVERKKKDINMSEVHDIALGLNSWNVSAEIFKFVDQKDSSNETANGESFDIFRAFYLVASYLDS